ncbi:MAG TPA: peptide-methionine (S)-S-oxide reductase, partial [Luteimonas sp.]|nr:peptide-methionine (S)-S-oxide reductase [Luteimonas sp.]
MIGIGAFKQRLPGPGEALPGRATEMPLHDNRHHVLGTPLRGDFEGLARVQFGMGCFWGAERKFWSLPGVATTAAGYAGGLTPNPDYREVCS